MSRSGYSDDDDGDYPLALWRGAVASSIRGKRGQALLRETLAALDAMPVKKLVASTFETDGQFCTLGVVGARRGVALQQFLDGDPASEWTSVDHDGLAAALGVASALVREIMYENDEHIADYDVRWEPFVGPLQPWDWMHRTIRVETPRPDVGARRWRHMRVWVASQITAEAA